MLRLVGGETIMAVMVMTAVDEDEENSDPNVNT